MSAGTEMLLACTGFVSIVRCSRQHLTAGTAPVWEGEGTRAMILKHTVGDDIAQHAEVAFPREEKWSSAGCWA